MIRFLTLAATLVLATSSLQAQTPERARIDEAIARIARTHGVPEALVHRIVLRESRYAPRLVSRGHYGLMQISYPTARSMKYSGRPEGLLDVETNLTYAVPYLANAWRLSGESREGAVRLYSSGYYDTAKKRKAVSSLRTAASPSLEPPPKPAAFAPVAPPPPEDDGVAGFFRSLVGADPAPAE